MHGDVGDLPDPRTAGHLPTWCLLGGGMNIVLVKRAVWAEDG